MIAIDTNVLLRYLLFDDEIQSKKAAKLIDSHQSIYVSHIVLVETIWTLKGRKYKLTPEQIDRTISAFFEEPSIVMQDDDLIWRALIDYRAHTVNGSRKLDFPDALIGHLGRDAAEKYGEEFGGFYTFDANARSALKFAKAP